MSRPVVAARAGLVVGAGLALAGTGSSAAAASGCDAIDVYDATSAKVAACGARPVAAVSTTRHDDGGVTRSYRFEDRTTAEMVAPPVDFDPLTAAPEELDRYGIPREPSDPEGRAEWLKAAAKAHFVTPPDHLVQLPIRAANLYTQNWSGYVNYANTFTTASAEWVQPYDHGTSCGSANEATWVGLGGYNSSALGQNGTNVNGQAWWEVLPYAQVGMPLNATAGQKFKAETTWEPSNSRYKFWWYNTYTGAMTTLYRNEPSSHYDGSTADYIVERPRVSGSLTPLTNVGTVSFTRTGSATAGGGSGTAAAFPSASIEMDNGSTVLATPGALNGAGAGDFGVTWKACA